MMPAQKAPQLLLSKKSFSGFTQTALPLEPAGLHCCLSSVPNVVTGSPHWFLDQSSWSLIKFVDAFKEPAFLVVGGALLILSTVF